MSTAFFHGFDEEYSGGLDLSSDVFDQLAFIDALARRARTSAEGNAGEGLAASTGLDELATSSLQDIDSHALLADNIGVDIVGRPTGPEINRRTMPSTTNYLPSPVRAEGSSTQLVPGSDMTNKSLDSFLALAPESLMSMAGVTSMTPGGGPPSLDCQQPTSFVSGLQRSFCPDMVHMPGNTVNMHARYSPNGTGSAGPPSPQTPSFSQHSEFFHAFHGSQTMSPAAAPHMQYCNSASGPGVVSSRLPADPNSAAGLMPSMVPTSAMRPDLLRPSPNPTSPRPLVGRISSRSAASVGSFGPTSSVGEHSNSTVPQRTSFTYAVAHNPTAKTFPPPCSVISSHMPLNGPSITSPAGSVGIVGSPASTGIVLSPLSSSVGCPSGTNVGLGGPMKSIFHDPSKPAAIKRKRKRVRAKITPVSKATSMQATAAAGSPAAATVSSPITSVFSPAEQSSPGIPASASDASVLPSATVSAATTLPTPIASVCSPLYAGATIVASTSVTTNGRLTSPKSAKGGWPKGKPRSRREFGEPRPVLSSWQFFISDQYKSMGRTKDSHLTKNMKHLAAKWQGLSEEEKKIYEGKAAADKKRYLEELRVFQKSDTYSESLCEKVKEQFGENCTAEKMDADVVDALKNTSEVENTKDLYCSLCQQLFTTQHNHLEHLLGRKHLQNVKKSAATKAQSRTNAPVPPCSVDDLLLTHKAECFMEEFFDDNRSRDLEIQELKTRQIVAQVRLQRNQEAVGSLETHKSVLHHRVSAITEHKHSLQTQLDALQATVRNFQSLEPASKRRSPSCGQTAGTLNRRASPAGMLPPLSMSTSHSMACSTSHNMPCSPGTPLSQSQMKEAMLQSAINCLPSPPDSGASTCSLTPEVSATLCMPPTHQPASSTANGVIATTSNLCSPQSSTEWMEIPPGSHLITGSNTLSPLRRLDRAGGNVISNSTMSNSIGGGGSVSSSSASLVTMGNTNNHWTISHAPAAGAAGATAGLPPSSCTSSSSTTVLTNSLLQLSGLQPESMRSTVATAAGSTDGGSHELLSPAAVASAPGLGAHMLSWNDWLASADLNAK
eukprot:scpid32215/ scgid6018/ 